MAKHSPKQQAIAKINVLAEDTGWEQIIFSLKREWASMAPREVFRRAAEVLEGEENAVEWMTTRQYALGWNTPLDFCSMPQGKQGVLDVLGRIEHGLCL